MNEFATANVKLEQFLFVHRIRWKKFRKNEDMLTEWVYDRTPYLEEIVAEFRRVWNLP